MFSQAAGVTDLLANEAQCSSVMEKTHAGPTGGRIYVPWLHTKQTDGMLFHIRSPTPFGIIEIVKTLVIMFKVSGSGRVKKNKHNVTQSSKALPTRHLRGDKINAEK